MRDEPAAHRRYLWLLALCAVAASPFAFAGRPTQFVLGLPLWLWWSGAWTVALAGVTAWGILRHWKDDELE